MVKKIIGSIAIFLFFYSCLYANKTLVTTIKPYSNKTNPTLQITGSAYFFISSNVASETAGKVKKVYINEGDKVKKGDPLVLLDDEIISYLYEIAKVETKIAQSNFDKAKKDYDRSRSLFEKRAVALSEFERIETEHNNRQHNYLSAIANEKRIATQKTKFLILSPINGFITSKDIEVGEWVNEGGSVASIGSNSYEARVNVPENILPYLKVGDNIRIESNLKEYEGRILSINHKGDLLTRTYGVRIYLGEDENLKQGVILKAHIPANTPIEALFLPRDTIVTQNGKTAVYVLEKDKVVIKNVQFVGYRGKDMGVLGELSKDSIVIREGNNKVKVGQSVEVINKSRTR